MAWRRMSIVAQVALFVLTVVGVVAFYWLCKVLDLPKGWLTAIVSVAVAELLIRRQRFCRTGVEPALWIAGLFAFIFALPSSGKPEAILLFVAASAIAGWRMRNALFGTGAVVLVVAYLEQKGWPAIAAGFALAVCAAALLAELRLWQRPSTELLWRCLLITAPMAAYVPLRHDRVFTLFAALAAVLLAAGIRFRLRFVLIAFAVAAAIAANEVRLLLRVSIDTYLIVAGAIVLAIAAMWMRALRARQSGFVLEDEPHELDELLQIAGTLPLAAPSAAAARPTPGGGGQFGGAGASGDF